MLPTALLSWFRVQPGTTLARVQLFLYRATEPVLRPVRRVIRPIGGIDISFIVVFLVLQVRRGDGFSSRRPFLPGKKGVGRPGSHG